MKDRKVKNVAASVRQRLLNVAKASGRPFQEVLQYYAMERFLYRLAQSPHADRFVLKGALMLSVWRTPTTRPTKDIDLLGHMSNQIDEISSAISDACLQSVEQDGLEFDPKSVVGMIIKEDADYEGVRVQFRGSLQNIPLPMQIDVGFGDIVFPNASLAQYPTILDHSPPELLAYSRETMVAEKFEAMVKLGQLNSRMKDFYDIWLLSRQFDFDGQQLATAIEKTFTNRGTAVEPQPTAFMPVFAIDKSKVTQWQAFTRKTRLSDAPSDLGEVTAAISDFLSSPAAAIVAARSFNRIWHAPGPWTD